MLSTVDCETVQVFGGRDAALLRGCDSKHQRIATGLLQHQIKDWASSKAMYTTNRYYIL